MLLAMSMIVFSFLLMRPRPTPAPGPLVAPPPPPDHTIASVEGEAPAAPVPTDAVLLPLLPRLIACRGADGAVPSPLVLELTTGPAGITAARGWGLGTTSEPAQDCLEDALWGAAWGAPERTLVVSVPAPPVQDSPGETPAP
jgi:hypothetical protein